MRPSPPAPLPCVPLSPSPNGRGEPPSARLLSSVLVRARPCSSVSWEGGGAPLPLGAGVGGTRGGGVGGGGGRAGDLP
jgi:hypothetical protein